jgi:hypothetical protein
MVRIKDSLWGFGGSHWHFRVGNMIMKRGVGSDGICNRRKGECGLCWGLSEDFRGG